MGMPGWGLGAQRLALSESMKLAGFGVRGGGRMTLSEQRAGLRREAAASNGNPPGGKSALDDDEEDKKPTNGNGPSVHVHHHHYGSGAPAVSEQRRIRR